MKPFRTIMIKNGDMLEPYRIYTCECCGEDVKEAWPRYANEDGVYCVDCAFKLGLVDDKFWLQFSGFGLANARAAFRDGMIHVVCNNQKFPWEKTNKQQRHSDAYVEWRRKVFERDGYTCAICGEVGGELNAHHIKPFAKFPELRTDVDNGITLCKKCHKKVHTEKDSKWLHDGK